MAVAADPDRQRIRGRRGDRHHAAHRGGGAARHPRRQRHRREQAGSRRHHRDRGCVPQAGRRLHPAGRPELHVERPADDEAEAQLRLRRQVHDRLAGRRRAALDDPGPQGAQHQGLEIVCRLLQGQPRQDPLCESRRADRTASRHDAGRQSARRGLDAHAAEGRRRHPQGALQRGREHRPPEHRGRMRRCSRTARCSVS